MKCGGDPDGDLTDVTWQSSKSADMDSWMDISGATSMSYAPTSMDVGYHLRATATYTDLLGSGKTPRAVSNYAMTAVDPLVARYDANKDGWIQLEEARVAVGDYFGPPKGVKLSLDDTRKVVGLYFEYKGRQ